MQLVMRKEVPSEQAMHFPHTLPFRTLDERFCIVRNLYSEAHQKIVKILPFPSFHVLGQKSAVVLVLFDLFDLGDEGDMLLLRL